jgi:hypothetical protein
MDGSARLLLSDSQSKVSALLCKITGLVQFASDEECEAAFLSLAQFAKRLLQFEKQTIEERARYSSMNLEELIDAPCTYVPPNEELTILQVASPVNKRIRSKFESMAIVSSANAKVAKVSTTSSRDKVDTLLTRKRAIDLPCWDFEINPNVVDILRIDHPPLKIVFTSRPKLLGNHVPVTVFADLQKLLQLSKEEKHALRGFKKAIIRFSKANPLSSSLKGPLFDLPWASKSFKSKLLFNEEDDDDE